MGFYNSEKKKEGGVFCKGFKVLFCSFVADS